MTGDQHTDHITNGQRVSRHSLPTLLYFLFSPPHIFFNSILARRTLAQLESNKNENTKNLLKGAVTKNGDSTTIGQEEKTGQGSQEIENIKENESNYILTPDKGLPLLSESGNDNYPTKGDVQR